MCGIAGIQRFDGSAVDPAAIEAMIASLRHRGPDECGKWISKSVGLGHCRLSIIDVSGSHQPMASNDEKLHVVFNGEILNYKGLREQLPYSFRTRGDTEVLLALHQEQGSSSVQQLRGQFAYAIHDDELQETHLYRDRFGVLPLYYYQDSRFFAFASEIKALLPLIPSRRIDDESLHDYLSHRSVPAPFTLIEGVFKVRPGHHLIVKADGTIESRPYWELPTAPARNGISVHAAVRKTDRVLRNSVQEALVADVPVGVYLSGGVDSSLLTAVAAAQVSDGVLHTFSASFGDARFDENHWAVEVSRLFGTEHHDVLVTAEDFLNHWGRLSWHRDGPLSEPADVAINRLATLARQHVKVVLSGEGSDEIFGGYPKYKYANATRWLGGKPIAPLLRSIEPVLSESRSRLRIAVRAMSELTYEERMRGWFSPFTLAERERLLRGPSTRSVIDPYRNGRGDAVRRMLYADMFSWLSDNLLERGDRMSMAASLETRPPFLDHRLVELAFSLPSRYKVRNGTTKWVLKQVALSYLPADIVNRPKVGFKVPLDSWFRGGLRDFAHDLLTGPGSMIGERFDKAVVGRILDRHQGLCRNEEVRIWTLLSLEVWHREMRDRGLL